MAEKQPLQIDFPGDADYIPAVRKFVAEASQIEGFSAKFAYRTEIIIDELTNNAVKFGPNLPGTQITLRCEFLDDSIALSVQDAGGESRDVENLKHAITSNEGERFLGRGLEIVKMLSSYMELSRSESGETVVRVVKRRSQNVMDNLPE